MTTPTDRDLDAFRHVGDPLADAVVAECARLRRRGDPVELIEELAREDFEPAVHLLHHVRTVPAWVDFAAMRPAFDVALQNVIPSGMALMAGSLVESYVSGRGAKVLVATGRLRTDTLRRLFETAKFASDLALDGGAQPGTVAWRNVVAVRVMHAWVRHGLRNRADWDHDKWGLPINQEDYAATLFMFSLVYRRSLERLGIPLTASEHAGAQLNWRYVGWLLGVDEALLPTDCADEARRYATMMRRNYTPDDDSRALALSLLDAMSGNAPFFLPRGALHAFSRRLVGDELADALGIERSRRWDLAVGGSRALTAVAAGAARRTGPVSVWCGARLTTGIVSLTLPGGTRFAHGD